MTDPAKSGRGPIALPTDRASRLQGIGLMCLAVLMFGCLDTTAKYLTTRMDVLQVVWARYFFHFLVSFAFVNPWTVAGLLRSRRPGLQVFRSALLLLSTVCNFTALRYLQVDQTVAVSFSAPFIVAVLAGPLLGEWVGARRLIAIVLGFVGVLVVTRPGADMHWAFAFTFGAAAAYALYNLATRILAAYDRTATTLFYSALIGTLVVMPVVPFVWTWPETWLDWALMVAVGGFGALGHWLLIIAHRLAPASVVAPFIYAELLWVSVFGWFVFADVPSEWTLAGAAIVIASGLYLLYRERQRNLPPSAEPAEY
jgi:drug/metabolite transporter (DMT)-like permease